VTNVTYIFGTFPNTKPEKRRWGGHGILYPPTSKSGGDMSPTKLRPCPRQLL